MKTLLAHEWIAEVGGSENVFEQIRLSVPDSRAVCLWNDDPTRFAGVEETWLARSPLRGRKAAAMPFYTSAWNRVDLAGIDRVVVSSHAFSHHLASRAAKLGIAAFAYVHSPARYVWVPDLDDRGNSLVGRLGRSYFRRWDRQRVSDGVHYAASKGGIVSLTRAMAMELAMHGIRVNAIAPGLTDTAQPRYGHTEEELRLRALRIPLGRMGRPEDIANVAVFLASEDAAFMTGQTVHANGGTYMPS